LWIVNNEVELNSILQPKTMKVYKKSKKN